MGTEVELKLRVGAEHFSSLEASLKSHYPTSQRLHRRTLTSTYFDTPDLALHKAGAMLRIRKNGRSLIQTFKYGKGGVLAERPEFEARVTAPKPDLSLIADEDYRAKLVEMVADQPLLPVFATSVRRTTHLVETSDGQVEVAFDEGSIVAAERRTPLEEIELELKSGTRKTLFALARQMLDGRGVGLSAMAKSDLGYRLAAGEPIATEPSHAETPQLSNDMTLDEGLQIILRSSLTQIANNVAATIENDAPEGPHQLRVGLRRFRTALGLLKSETAGSAAELSAEAKRIGACVAPVRDLDVMRDDIVASLADRVDVSGVLAILDEERQRRRGSLLAELKGPEVGGFLIDLAEFVETRGWASQEGMEDHAPAAPLSEFAANEVKRRWRKIRKHAALAEDLDEAGRHELRKKFRRLRYTVDGFAVVLDERTLTRTQKQTRNAQNVLGYLNDVSCSRHLPAMIHKPGVLDARPDPDAIRHAVGFVLGWHEAQAARAWAKIVKRLKLPRCP